jgi:hypothetical protein
MVTKSNKKKRVGKNRLAATMAAEARRTEIIRIIYKAGSPHLITEQSLADHFGISRSMIAKDMIVIRQWMSEHYGDDGIAEISAGYQSAMTELSRNKDYKTLHHYLKGWSDFLFRTGKIVVEPEKFEVSVRETISVDDVEAAYRALRKKYDREDAGCEEDTTGG